MASRVPRFLLYPLAAVVPALGLAVGGGAAAQASSTYAPGTWPAASSVAFSAALSTADQAASVAKDFIRHLMVDERPGGQHIGSGIGSAPRVYGRAGTESSTWSGYADTGGAFTKVSASWKEPAVSCGSGISLAALWVGIDGDDSSSVEQDGTTIECYLGQEYQYTWWEMYPTESIQTVGQTVAAGDSITASVVRSGTSYTLSVIDSTHPANSFRTARACTSCTNTSAEWIAEAPGGTQGVYALPDFGTWSASRAAVTKGTSSGTISSFADDQITMADDQGNVEAQPSSLSKRGSAFSVTWKSSS